ncbi:MFS transporter [Priestia megaterium]|nr:MFS transporter [Priestia megaterium]
MVFSAYYFFVFFGIGGLFPLLSVYLTEVVELSGTQVGVIMSISPVVMIVAQPFWGLIADYTQKTRLVLTVTLICTGVAGIFFSFSQHYYFLILLAGVLAFFQGALIPLSDSITLNYITRVHGDYGAIRLWGAIGFAVAVLIVGGLAEKFGLHIIFYIFASILSVAALLAWLLPKESQSLKVDMRSGIRELMKMKKFILFLWITFLIFGPISANNFYFGIYITSLGGTLTGVGIAFLLAAGSEAPFMKVASVWIKKIGVMKILLLAACIAFFRWTFYFLEPPLLLIYLTTVVQGFSIGLFIPAALQYVRDLAPLHVRATAVSVYAAVGNGMGSWFCTFLGGVILEHYHAATVYGFFMTLTLLGCVLIVILKRIETKEANAT